MPDVAALSVSINADTTGLEAGLSRAQQHVTSAGSAIQSALGVAAVAGVAALGAGLVASVKSAADFEKQMSAVGAVAGASASEMQQLTSAALQLGKDTSFSASEAAKGIEELVKAGVSVGDVLGGGARAALDLAAAGAISVGDAAEIASNAMNVFGLKGADMAHVADVIAGAANASAIGVNDYKFSLAAAGAVANTVGISFESLSQAIAVMGNAGIKGSDAGTSLKTMLLNLQPSTNAQRDEFRRLGLETSNLQAGMDDLIKHGVVPMTNDWGGLNAAFAKWKGISADHSKWTKENVKDYEKWAQQTGLLSSKFFDASGNAKSMAEIAEVLKTSMAGMTKQQQLASLEILFGSDAIRAGAVLLEAGAAGFEEMAEAMGKVTAQSVANERLNNLWGSVEKLKGSLETAAIILGGQFTPALKRMADQATDAVNVVIEVIEKLPGAWQDVVSIFTDRSTHGIFESVLFDMGFNEATVVMVDNIIASIGDAFRSLAPYIQTVADTFVSLAAPIAAAVAAFLGVIAVAGLVQAAIAAVAAVLALLLSPLGLVALAAAALALAWTTNFMGIQEQTAAMWAAVQPVLMELVAWLGEKIPPVLDWISTVGWPALVTAGLAVSEWITGTAIPALTQLVEWLGPKVQEVTTWISDTGWPALVTAGEAVSDWITSTGIPALTDLVAWLGPKIQEVTTWITDTGWPALVTAGEAVYAMVQEVIKFFTDLFTELEKRGVFTDLEQIWIRVEAIGVKLAPAIQKIGEALAPVFEWVSKLVEAAVLPALVIIFGALETSTTKAGGPVGVIATAIEKFVKVISDGLKGFEAFVALMERLAKVKLPSLPSFGGGGDGGGGGTQTLSYTPSNMPAGQIDNSSRSAFAQSAYPLALQAAGGNPELARRFIAMAMSENGTVGRGGPIGVGFNFGGIKYDPQASGSGSYGTWEMEGGQRVNQNATFAHYANAQEGFNAIPRFLQTNFPRQWAEYQRTGDAAGLIRAINAGGYATNPTWFQDIEQITRQSVPAAPPSNPAGMQRIPLSSAPGATPDQWPGFMNQVEEQLPAYLMSLETIQGKGTETFTGTAQAGTTQAAVLSTGVAQEYDLMKTKVVGSVTSMGTGTQTALMDSVGNTVVTVTAGNGEILNQYAQLSNGASFSIQDMAVKSTTSINDMTGEITRVMTDASGNVVTTVTTASGQVVEQYVKTAGEVVAANTGMNAQVVAVNAEGGKALVTNNAATGTRLISDVTNTAGVTVERYREMNGDIVTIVTDQNGKVVADFTRTAAEVAMVSDTSKTQLISTTTDAMGQTTEVYREKSGEIVTIVTDAGGKTISEFRNVATAGKSSAVGIDSFKSALGSIKPPNLSGVVKEFEKVEKAAKQAWEAGKKIGEGFAGGRKSGSGGDSGLGKKAAGGWTVPGQLTLVGEEGPELLTTSRPMYVTPNSRLGGGYGGGGGGMQTIRLQVEIGGRVAEEIYVTGRELATRRGRN